jgi:hypothetical protein
LTEQWLIYYLIPVLFTLELNLIVFLFSVNIVRNILKKKWDDFIKYFITTIVVRSILQLFFLLLFVKLLEFNPLVTGLSFFIFYILFLLWEILIVHRFGKN